LCCPRPRSSDAHPWTHTPSKGAVLAGDALCFLPARKSSPGFRKSKGAFLFMLKNQTKKPPNTKSQQTPEHPATSQPAPHSSPRPVSGELTHFVSVRKSPSLADGRVWTLLRLTRERKALLGGSFYPACVVNSPKTSCMTSSLRFQGQATSTWAGTVFGWWLLMLPSYQLTLTDLLQHLPLLVWAR